MIDIHKKPSTSLNKNKYKSTIGFTDLLFNLLVGFVYLFIIAFILINPIQKKHRIESNDTWKTVIQEFHCTSALVAGQVKERCNHGNDMG